MGADAPHKAKTSAGAMGAGANLGPIGTYPQPASVSVLVETAPPDDDTKPSALTCTYPGEMVPASREAAQVDITGGTAAFASASAPGTTKTSDDKFSFASMSTGSPTTKSGNDDSDHTEDKKNNDDKKNKERVFAYCLFQSHLPKRTYSK